MGAFSLASLLGKAAPVIGIVDVGAMQIGGTPPFYKPLMDAGLARVVGFEPQEDECRRLNAMNRRNHRYLPYFVGDGTERTFYLTNHSYTSSLYEPNRELVDRLTGLGEVMQVVSSSTVRTRRLDDLEELGCVDFLKLDVQGAELDVLRGGERTLAGCVVVESEVEFVPLYKGQPLFAEIDQHLRRSGFMLHALHPLSGRAYKPLLVGGQIAQYFRQVLWTDAIYIPEFDRWASLGPEQLLKLALILHEVYGSFDLAALAIQHHDARTGKDLWTWYMKRLITGPLPGKPPQ